MSAVTRIDQPNGALAELHTDEPLGLVAARFRAHAIKGVHIEQRGRRRWLVVDTLPEQPIDYPADETPATRRWQIAEIAAWLMVLAIGVSMVLTGVLL